MEKLRSPINYTGNKFRILDQIKPYFPQKCGVFLDLFSGGATVGINVDCEKVYFVDNNERVIRLLDFLAKSDFDKLLKELEKMIDYYGLSYSAKNGYKFYKDQVVDNPNNGLKKYNEKGYYKLRKDYNNLKDKTTKKANKMLYLLMVYAFNNDIRFSAKGNFNLPAGKTDLNRSNIKKVRKYIEKMANKKYQFICSSFNSEKVKNILKEVDFVYLDPPYLITKAFYNENNGWNAKLEHQLLDFLDYLIEAGKPFVLSNVLEKRGSVNEPLAYWIHRNKSNIKIVDIEYHYRSSNYQKKDRNAQEREIIVVFKGANK